MAANYEAIMREQNIATAEQRCCFMLGVSAAEKAAEALKPSHNSAMDAMQRLCELSVCGYSIGLFYKKAMDILRDYRAAQHQ
jgi:hypothetical protein